MPNLLGAIFQVFDYIGKALTEYAKTEEGQAELLDIIQAWEGDEFPERDNPVHAEATK